MSKKLSFEVNEHNLSTLRKILFLYLPKMKVYKYDWSVETEPDAKNPKSALGNLEKLGKDFRVNTVSILQSLFRLQKGQIVCCISCMSSVCDKV